MEIVFCHASYRGYVVNDKGLQDSSSHPWKLPLLRVRGEALCRLVLGRDSLRLKKLEWHRYRRRIQSSKNSSAVSRRCYSSYILDGGEDRSSVSGSSQTTSKISIPGLPDEDNVASISSRFWEWKPKLTVHYETAGSENVDSPAVLFLPGFGVGSFHYEKQLKDLGRECRAWALDFLGQGLSLPCEDPTSSSSGLDGEGNNAWGFGDESETWAEELVFSIDLWRDQVRYFIEEVIKEPVYLVGNSLGGFVALYFAACNPELVKGVTLLNATPFWGFLPNRNRSPRLSRAFPWAGTFPFPPGIRRLTEIMWAKISDPQSISEVLKQVYADHSTEIEQVYARILETTQHPAAAASFGSIIFAPQGQLSFDEALIQCRTNKTPICLMYGREDPWVRPVWGLQVKRRVPDAPYYEISPAGHCPHDEAPEVVNFLLRGWIKNLESRGSIALPLAEIADCEVAEDLEFSREGERKSMRVKLHGSKFSIWNWRKLLTDVLQPSMGKKAKGSRKGKKAWRANISTEDIEDYFEKSTKDALSGGSLADVPSDSLFFVDKSRDLSVKRKIEKSREKVLRCDSLLQRNPFVKPIPSSITKKKKSSKRCNTAHIKEDTYVTQETPKDESGPDSEIVDLWEKKGEDSSKKNKRKTRSSTVPAVVVEPPGCSFNPDPDSHQDALACAVAVEMQKIYQHELGPEPIPLVAPGEAIDEEERYFLEADNEDDDDDGQENEDLTDNGAEDTEKRPLITKRVTRVELNRRARRKEQLKAEAEAKKAEELSKNIDSISDIIQEIEEEDEEKRKRHLRRVVAKQERLKTHPPRLGKYKFEPAPLQVLLSEEKTGSLRQLKGCSTLVRDRYKNLERRGLVVPSKKGSRT
ncbi:pheophytinase, chloroplastic-like [Andrographis paniculata]|uniref:pheophytinase, chloroplastic-like n=1 Tax=Andrographis paniculata TaxID=175694 RepID=UPI0021E818DC|nr:pheophytinase, chloroplastic-like [Andrographis paniculata]